MTTQNVEIRQEMVDAAKIGAGTTAGVVGYLTLNDWVAICTIIYLVLQSGLLIPKYIEKWRNRNKSP